MIGDKIGLKDLTIGMMDEVSPRWMADEKPAMHREEVVDIRGMAQLINLLESCDHSLPKNFRNSSRMNSC